MDNIAFKIDPEDPAPPEEQKGKNGMVSHSPRSSVDSRRPSQLLTYFGDAAESFNLLVGHAPFLETSINVFVRLDEGRDLGELSEAPLPTRYLFISMGPSHDGVDYFEIGRCMGAIMSTLVSNRFSYFLTHYLISLE